MIQKKELSKTEKEILKRIALNGYKTDYELSKKDKVAADSTVYHALRKFESLGLIEIKREEPFLKIKGRMKKYYGLTFRGLVSALKIEGVRLHQIQNRNELISSWIHMINKASFVKISKQDWKRIEKVVLEHLNQYLEEAETFLKHYDLDNSDNYLIFYEWVNYAIYRSLSGAMVNRVKRRELERMAKQLPESFKPLFLIPELCSYTTQKGKEGVEC